MKLLKADNGLWRVPLTATVIEIDTAGSPPIGFQPDDRRIKCGGMNGLWWCRYDWLEILRPEDDPLSTQQVTPSREQNFE